MLSYTLGNRVTAFNNLRKVSLNVPLISGVFMLKSQLLIPTSGKFELRTVLHENGYGSPTPRHYTHLRNHLRDNGYVRHSIVGRDEYWIYEATMTDEERAEVKCNADKPQLWTVESYAIHVLRMLPPFDPITHHRIERTLLADGFVPRRRPGQPTYWSARTQRRAPRRRVLPPPTIPSTIRYPAGLFTLYDFLTMNCMRRYAQNLQWARTTLSRECQGVNGKWVRPNAQGDIPAAISGRWRAPGPSFTTAQFQRFNDARRVTVDQWLAARKWLADNGYVFNPRYKRWVISTPVAHSN